MTPGQKYFAFGALLGFAIVFANTMGWLAPLRRPGYQGTGES